MATTQPYRIRPGTLSDIPRAVQVYQAAFDHDRLFDFLFPNRHEHPEALCAHATRLFQSRWWTPNFDFYILAGVDDNQPAGLTWWKRPDSQLSFYERWVSPYAWIASVVRTFFSLRNWLFPIPNLDAHAAHTFARVFDDVGPKLLSTPRRKDAWYLSILAVDPALHGKGLGTMLVRDGLQRADARGAATWLIGLKGIDPYYQRFGFAEIARVNVGELQEWEGGSIMFRNE